LNNPVRALALCCSLALAVLAVGAGCTPLIPRGESGVSQPGHAASREGVYHTVRKGETLWRISRAYGVSIAEITEANGLTSYDLAVGQRLLIPGAERELHVSPARPTDDEEPGTPGDGIALKWPLAGRSRSSVTSGFGPRDGNGGGSTFHKGIDIAGAREERVMAAGAGEVVFSGKMSGYGNVVMIDHGRRLITVYAHLSRSIVKLEDKVSAGQVIGYVGSTGISTGDHLHFEVRHKGVPVDPLDFLP
jgi:lipoprotein NlpD